MDAGGEYADVYLMLSDLLRDQGETKTAERAYQNALRLNGNLARGRRVLERGTARESKGEGTSLHFRKYAARDPAGRASV